MLHRKEPENSQHRCGVVVIELETARFEVVGESE